MKSYASIFKDSTPLGLEPTSISGPPQSMLGSPARSYPTYQSSRRRSSTNKLSPLQALVLSEAPKDHNSLTNLHRQLLSDPCLVSRLLNDETSRETFLLSFPEKAATLLEFLAKVKPLAARAPGTELPLAEAFVKDLILPLLKDEHKDLFLHVEFIELISSCLSLFFCCDGSPADIRTVTSRIAQLPNLVERLVSHHTGKYVLTTILDKERYETSIFEQDALEHWIRRLLSLVGVCGFGHSFPTANTKWKAILELKAAYPLEIPKTSGATMYPRPAVQQPFTYMRRLSESDKKSGSLSSAKEPVLSVPSGLAARFEYFKAPVPRTLTAARNLVAEIAETYLHEIFYEILESFPCNFCHGSFSFDRRISRVDSMFSNDMEEDNVAETVAQQDTLQEKGRPGVSLGLWRIVFSKQAMKDLVSAEDAGIIKAIDNKLKELAMGTWGRRRSLTKKTTSPGLPVPLAKAIYDSNGRIMWHVHVAYDETLRTAKQVILVWRIGDHKQISSSIPIIERNQKTYSKDFVEACKVRQLDPTTGVCLPATFQNVDLLNQDTAAKLTQEESLDLHNAIITGKFYTITQTVLDGLHIGGPQAEFRFDVSQEESAIIHHSSSSSFILGRSGTGKTTCLVFKLLARLLSQKQITENIGLRQIFITRSSILADKLNRYIHRLIDCELGKFRPSDDQIADAQEQLVEEDESKKVTELWSLQENAFPLVCSFDQFMEILEKTIKVAQGKGVTGSDGNIHDDNTQLPLTPLSPKLRRNSLLRAPRQVDFETFNNDYWRRFSNSTRKNLPVDLVFSEVLGIIKGSTSSLTGLRPLTREEYVSRSCRIAPLFTLETERQSVYDVFETYEKMKVGYQDWDAIDRTRHILAQLHDDRSLLIKLRELIDELYVDEIQDQKLLEIELLFTLVKSPLGINLAGDSAQCISRDSTFRFNDIKALFYGYFSNTLLGASRTPFARPKVFTLARNYRSHQGITALGALLVDCLWRGFPDLIDKLLPESGKYGGPRPTFFAGFKADDLLINQSFGLTDIYKDCADFGAEQVVLVRDEEMLAELESKLGSEVLILTVLQSKGMEFDDVVLLNFFSSSPYHKHYRAWETLINPNCSSFDSKKHSVLCSEFKNLYVAVTRCRSNLRIVEEASDIAELIIELLTKKVPEDLVEPVRPGDHNVAEKLKQLRSGSSGNTESWKRNADYLMYKKLYKQAHFCYTKAGHVQGQTLATAFLRRQLAEEMSMSGVDRESVEAVYTEAASFFEKADYPQRASECYEIIGKFKTAAEMWTERGKPEKAAPLYEQCELWDLAAESYTHARLFTEGTRSLRSGKLYDQLVDYLYKYEHQLDPDVYKRTARLCNLFHLQGKFTSSAKEKVELLLGSPAERESFYRSHGLTDSLIDHLTSPTANRVGEAFRHLISIGHFERALFLSPFEVLRSQVPLEELQDILRYLLIRDLRACGDTGLFSPDRIKLFERIDPNIGLLRDALIRYLRTILYFEDSRSPSDDAIDGYDDCKIYVRLSFLERIQTRIENVAGWGDLPINNLHGIITLLEQFLRDGELTQVLKTYFGFYRTDDDDDSQPFHVYNSSPLNLGNKSFQSIAPDIAVDEVKKWLGTLVMNAFYATLDRAWDFWRALRPSKYCTYEQIEGHCTRSKCTYYHEKMTQEASLGASEKIHNMCYLIRRLEYVYNSLRFSLDNDMTMRYRGRQRTWFEFLLEAITYVSAIHQTPVMPSPLLGGGALRSKQDMIVRAGVERIMTRQHLQQEWNSLADNFSKMLEELQRSEALGGRFAYWFRAEIRFKINQVFRNSSSERRLGFQAYQHCARLSTFNVNRPDNHEPQQFLYLFRLLKDLVDRNTAHFTSFHAVLSVFERIATYLFLVSSPEGFLLLNSWMTTHVPIVKSAAKHRLQRVKRTTFSMEGEVATYYEVGSRRESAQCLQELVMSLIHILNKLIHNTHGGQPSTDFRASHLPGDNRQWDRPAFEFTINRTRMRKEVLLRRCHDLIFVCTVNLYSLEFRSGVPLSFFSRLWPLVQKFMDDNYKGTGIKINWLPFPYTLGDLIAEFVRSFSVYNGKEALAVLARHNIEANSRFGRFPLLLRLPRHHEDFLREDPPTVSATSQARSSHHTWQQGPRPDLPEGDGDEEDAVVLSGSQLQAGRTIAKWWVTQWPLLQERRSFSKSDLGRATIDIGVLCQTIDIVDISNQYLGHTRTLSRFGPEPYSRLCSALKLGKRAVSAFQRVFAALPTGENELRADDLEKIDGWSEEVNKHIAQLERIKANIMDGIVVTKMGVVQLKVKLAEISGQAKVSEEKFVELTGNLDRVIAASRVKH